MIWGPASVGKSSIVAQCAAAHGLDFIDVRLSQLAPTDLRGLPCPMARCRAGCHRVLTEKEVAVIVAACLNPKLPSILARQFVRPSDLDVPVEALARLLGDDIALATATAAMLTDPESLTEATLADVPTRLPWIFPVVQECFAELPRVGCRP